MIERRLHRCSEPGRALSYLLDAERSRLGVRAITVSNARGRLVAGSGDGLERVAAQGAKLDRGELRVRQPEVATWRVRVRGEDMLITTLGRTMSGELGDGVRRILGQMQS
jgi:hypothetical protein